MAPPIFRTFDPVRGCALPVLSSIPICLLAGTAFGFLAGLGVGGGSLLMLWLTLVLEVPQDQARTMNLLFFLPAAVISCLFRWKEGSLPARKLPLPILAGCAAATVVSHMEFDESLLRKGFGVLLLLTGLRELFYRPRNAR